MNSPQPHRDDHLASRAFRPLKGGVVLGHCTPSRLISSNGTLARQGRKASSASALHQELALSIRGAVRFRAGRYLSLTPRMRMSCLNVVGTPAKSRSVNRGYGTFDPGGWVVGLRCPYPSRRTVVSRLCARWREGQPVRRRRDDYDE